MKTQIKNNSKKSWPTWMLAAGFLVAVIAVAAVNNAYFVSDRLLIQGYTQKFDISRNYSGDPLNVVASPGKAVNLIITARQSIKGYWSSDALNLVISTENNESQVLEVDQKQEKDWTDDIDFEILEKNDPVEIPVSFILPEDAVIGSDLLGTLTGQITYPVKPSGQAQEDQTTSLSIPLKIQVVSPDDLAQTVRNIAFKTLSISGPIAIICIVIPIAYFLKNRRKTPQAQTRKK